MLSVSDTCVNHEGVESVTRRYHVTLHSPMGPRSGTLSLEERNKKITGTLFLLAHQNPVKGRRSTDGRLWLYHQIVTAVCQYSCQSVFLDDEKHLRGELQMEVLHWCDPAKKTWAVMPWSGEIMETDGHFRKEKPH